VESESDCTGLWHMWLGHMGRVSKACWSFIREICGRVSKHAIKA
jgi:hypothetical protein